MRTVRASACEIKEISPETANDFIDKHHKSKSSLVKKSVNLGLFLEEELLGVIQFCTPRTAAKKREYTTELLRLSFKRETRVHGGASKLISFYRDNYSPVDFFTYQDTTGLSTDVYKHSGMTLVAEAKKKQYLVAPGKTLETAARKEYYSIGEVSRRGPDKLLGTNLGEIFRKDGKRKTNPELFIEELGWHLEETSGDRIWEWRNPNVSFYTYKITASDSDKYYYGVRQINIPNATIEDCLKDSYMGSGGGVSTNKFTNWKEKHKDKLEKEILKIHSTKAQAYNHEKSLVGDKWRTDPLCLNSIAGGLRSFKNIFAGVEVTIKECELHGKTKHRGARCYLCFNRTIQEEKCSVHGLTIHTAGKCNKCIAQNNHSFKECVVHGEVIHSSNTCTLCTVEKQFSIQYCEIHGKTRFRGDQCLICLRLKSLTLKECVIHGETKHQGETCLKCSFTSRSGEQECPEHGLTFHRSGQCLMCISKDRFKKELCPIHGETNHLAGQCYRCVTEKSLAIKICPTHGETKHRGNICCKCHSSKSIVFKICSIHGNVKHRGKNCLSCSAAKRVHNMNHKLVPSEDCSFCKEAESA